MPDAKEITERNVPEPPKFNLEDLPEPPKLDITSKKDSKPSLGNTDMNVIPPPPNSAFLSSQKKEINDIKADLADNMLNNLPMPPKTQEKKKGIFSGLFGKKKKEEKIDLNVLSASLQGMQDTAQAVQPSSHESKPEATAGKEEKIEMIPLNDDAFAPPSMKTDISQEKVLPLPTAENLAKEPLVEKSIPETAEEEPGWVKEGEEFEKLEDEESGTPSLAREQEMFEEGESYLKKMTPLAEVKGVGPAREKKLKKAGIKTAEHLASHDHKKLAKKINMPVSQAKEIVSNAQKITRIKEKLKETKVNEKKGISAIVKQLEEEKKEVEILRKKADLNEDKIIELEGHNDLIKVLETLEAKRRELVSQEEKLAEKEIKLSQHDETYRRDMEHIENLKRRLDHDIRERTQYLINLEREYFQKAQLLAKKQSDVEIKEKGIIEKEKFLKDREGSIKGKSNDIEDRELNLQTKEKKLEKFMRELEKQDLLLKEKEDDLLKREAEYMRKLDALETHEKSILKSLEERRKTLEGKEKEIEVREKKANTKERVVDKKSVAVEYAQNILEQEKSKLVDDEFEQYLHEQLGMLRNTGINIDDINFTKSISVPDLGKGKTIYQLIDTCKDLVRGSRVNEAKVFYNQIRDKYYDMRFDNPKEKEAIHNLLRSLYDEINLAEIGRNR